MDLIRDLSIFINIIKVPVLGFAEFLYYIFGIYVTNFCSDPYYFLSSLLDSG